MINFDREINRKGQFSAKYDELEMKFGRPDLEAMWVADMDFEVAPGISDAIIKRSHEKIYGYTSRPSEYIESMTSWYQRRHNLYLEQENIIYSPGVVTSLSVAVNTLTEKGDGIIIQPPVYFPFFEVIELNERRVVKNPLKKTILGYEIDFEGLEELAKKAKMLILCNPHNPVGRVWSEEELKRIASICDKNDVQIVSDEIHGDLVFNPHRYTPMELICEKNKLPIVTLLSATKTFNIPGLQASFIVSKDSEILEKLNRFFTIYDLKRNNCFSLVGVEAAYRTGEEWLSNMLDYVRSNMDYVKLFCGENLPKLKLNNPEGTYLLWLDCSELGLSDEKLSDMMINGARVAVNMGTGFGDEGAGHVRLNLACPRAQVERTMQAIYSAVDKLNLNKEERRI